ncbi:Transcriptional regulatory protein DegU [Streptomyces sp. YIM 121038]|uniref:helix-turn-helix transcriptional regulator n=1 Tax=unclassified Streptomyces TaxID=2593676 RepID=UPI001110DDC3|nr:MULTISPECIES: response regulator transcription factor [unclassified Streptomyces]QCX74526.1 Transcriptional regulatory protein DegU [Streptomyces sp. YIM 121038]
MQPRVESVPTTQPVLVTVHASDPISRAGVVSQLRQCAEIALTDGTRHDRAHVALLVVGAVDEATLVSLRRLVHAQSARVVLVVDRMRGADVLDVAGCGVTSIVRRREATPARLLRAVLAAHRGHGDLPPDLLGRLIAQMGRLQSSAQGPAHLTPAEMTPREVDILRLVADGLDTAEVAAKLAYSERTVKNDLQNLTSRLGLRNRTHAVAYALRAGYI